MNLELQENQSEAKKSVETNHKSTCNSMLTLVNGRTMIFQVHRTAELWGLKVRPNRAVLCRTKYGNNVRQQCTATKFGNDVRQKRTANFRRQYLGNGVSDLYETLTVSGPHLCSKSVKL